MTKQVFSETIHKNKGYYQSFNIDNILYKSKTSYQDLIIFNNNFWGNILVLDGIIQLTERDEFIYHEMITHVPILAHQNPKNVLIIGGGDGGVLREVLKHKKIYKIKLVEIDQEIISLSRKYLPRISAGAFENKKVEIIIEDGMNYVKRCKETFDLIILDRTDPIGCGEVLFTDEFYKSCKDLLTPSGIITAQSGVCFFQLDQLKQTMLSFSKFFTDWSLYSAAVPGFVGGIMAFSWGTNEGTLRKLSLKMLNEKFSESTISTKYYTPEIHLGSFAIPKYISGSLRWEHQN